MTEIGLRTATRQDLEAIVALLAKDPLGQTREDPESAQRRYEEAFAAIGADPNNALIVAEEAGDVIGCLQLTFIPSLTYTGGTRAQIEGVRVTEAARGLGVGRLMIEHALALARERGCVLAQLTSDKRRPEAIEFYEALGFRASHEGLKLWF